MSEKKSNYTTRLSMPDRPAIEPCSKEVSVEVAAFYRDGIACRSCRHWLIEVTTMGDGEPRYIHDRKIPPEITQGYEYEEILGWIENRYFEKLQTRSTWPNKQAIEQFRDTLVELLFELLGGESFGLPKTERELRERRGHNDSAKSTN